MRFQVPQFIEVEDKLFGPFSFSQFIYLTGGVASAFILWHFLPQFLAVLLIVPIMGFAAALSFYKVNGRPFVLIVESALKYYFGPKLYLWRKKEKPRSVSEKAPEVPIAEVFSKGITQSKLKNLFWSLDIMDETK